MNQDTSTYVKAEIKTEENISVPEWIKAEIKKEDDESFVDPGGFICPTCEMRYVNEESFLKYGQQHHSTSTGKNNSHFSQNNHRNQRSQSGEKLFK